ncbi:MAG: hypothetical protein Q7T61_04465 [Caulobacter sp.]|nr:hypothetical protein [Caulobacter sp.]
MRLFSSCLIAVGLLSAATGVARAQSLPDPTLERLRVAPADGRLASSLTDPGAPDAWESRDAPNFRLRWKGEESNWDISAASRFVEETEANARDFQTQGLFEAEGAVVRRFGDFRIGAVGYSARPVGEKTRGGPKLGAMKWQGNAAGPIVGYDTRLGGKPATVALRWYREIDAPGENGDTVSASFAVRF